jgi:NADH-quinone oxidoreductase subunit G
VGLDNAIASFTYELRAPSTSLERVAEFAVTASDPIVRRSQSLQKTADGKVSRAARFNAATLAKLGLAAGDRVRVTQGGGEAVLVAALDAALPDNVVRVARGVTETAALGEGAIAVEKSRETVAA